MLITAAIVLLALIAIFYIGGSWVFSNRIRDDVLLPEPPGEPVFDIDVVAVTDDTVELSLATDDEHLTAPGVRGVDWEGGYGHVGAIVETTAGTVVREFSIQSGALEKGTLVDLDGFSFPDDPKTAHGLDFALIEYDTALGPIDAWHIPGNGDDWVIFVHGRAAPKREALRMLPVVNQAGLHALVINYRNDPNQPADPSGFYRFGASEWQDLEGAVRYAIRHGADQIAVFGLSTGGAITASFLLESELSSTVDAVVFDAPILSLGATIDAGAADERLPLVGLPVPSSLLWTAKTLATIRFDVDWGSVDYLARFDELETPMLIFHGALDDRVPVQTSREAARLRPDLVTYVESADAGHVLSWNSDPDAYEQTLRAFLESHLG